MIKTAIFRCS